MKIKFIYLFAVAIFAYVVLSSQSGGTASNGGGARTGAPSEGQCQDCHAGGAYTPIISIRLLDSATGIAVNDYTGGRRYRLEVTISNDTPNTAPRFGAQATILQTSNNVVAGVLSNPSANARLASLNGRQYLEQSVVTATVAGSPVIRSSATYTASWISPPVGTGSVRIFASGVTANTNGSTVGDNAVTGSLLIPEAAPTTIRYSNDSFCLVGIQPIPVITGVTGGVFSSTTPGLVFIDVISGQINPALSLPGEYAVRYSYNTPVSEVFDTIVIVQQDQAIFNYPATVCKNNNTLLPTFAGTANGTFTSPNAGIVLDNNTGEIDIANTAVGTYSIVYTTPNVCADTQSASIEVLYVPTATFTYPSRTYCGNNNAPPLVLSPPPTLFTRDTLTGRNTSALGGVYTISPSGTQVDDNTGEILLNVNAPYGRAGIYQISYTTTATCPSTSTFTVTIESPSTGEINYSRVQYCENASNQGVTIIGAQNGRFFSPTGAVVNLNTGELNIQNSSTGNHTIAYVPISLCSDTTFTNIVIEERRSVFYEYPSVGYCMAQSFVLADSNTMAVNSNAYFYLNTSNSAITGSIASANGRFDFPAMPTNVDSVVYTIIRRDSLLCGSSDTTNLTVYRTGNAHFYYPNDTICDNAATQILPYIGGVAGGNFSISNNAFINTATGAINPDTMSVGQYLITYDAPPVCAATASQLINFVEADEISFSYTDYPLCLDGVGVPTITSASGSSIAGYFSARPLDTFARNPLRFSNTTTGEIDLRFLYYLANSAIPDSVFVGRYEVAYNILGSCPEVLYDTIQLQNCVFINENLDKNFSFSLYPNPAQDYVMIQNSNFVGDLYIRVYDLLGRSLSQKQQYFQQQTLMDLSTFEPGVYLVEIKDNLGNLYTQKILKQ